MDDPRFFCLRQMKKKLRIESSKKKKGADNQKEIDSLYQRIGEIMKELENEGKIIKKVESQNG